MNRIKYFFLAIIFAGCTNLKHKKMEAKSSMKWVTFQFDITFITTPPGLGVTFGTGVFLPAKCVPLPVYVIPITPITVVAGAGTIDVGITGTTNYLLPNITGVSGTYIDYNAPIGFGFPKSGTGAASGVPLASGTEVTVTFSTAGPGSDFNGGSFAVCIPYLELK